MKTIKLHEQVGLFAENKDIARDIRLQILIPALDDGETIILDFDGVDGATQSFVHALVSDLMRKYGNEVLDKIQFKSCNQTVQGIITMVVNYMQESTS